MVAALLAGLTVGFFLSIPPGPIAIAVMRQALEGNFKSGLKIGLGASTMDTLYSLVAVFASSAVVVVVKDTLTSNTWLMLVFQAACITTLVVMGVKYFKATTLQYAANERKELAQEERVHGKGYKSDYLMGIFMSVTNLASPTFIPSLIAVATFMHSRDLVDNSIPQAVLYAVGFGSGAALWFQVILRAVYFYRSRLSASFVRRLYQFAGWSFVVFAAILLFNVVIGTDWPHAFG